jgi:hypothetical protein
MTRSKVHKVKPFAAQPYRVTPSPSYLCIIQDSYFFKILAESEAAILAWVAAGHRPALRPD